MSTFARIDYSRGVKDDEYRQRILHALLGAAVRVAVPVSAPMKRLTKLLELAYFRELRRQGLSLQGAADRLGVSHRTATRLSRLLKTNFLDSTQEHELPRRVEFALWGEPMSAARLAQVMPEVNRQTLEQTLDRLVEEGRLELRPGRTPTYAPARGAYRLVQDQRGARIDALDNLVGSVARAVTARFFDSDDRAFARTLNLRVRHQDLKELQSLYEDLVWTKLAALDAAAQADPESESVSLDLSLLWAPRED